jgi:hypothetical protein
MQLVLVHRERFNFGFGNFLRLALEVTAEVRFAPILLQKSFWGVERKFLEPLVRFARGDVRDHIG